MADALPSDPIEVPRILGWSPDGSPFIVGAMTSYAFPNAWELARRRMELLEACYDPSSFAHAHALGVRRGWRCLDAGAGDGSFARRLASRVEETGSVVAADIDTRLMKDLAAPNVEVRQMDLSTDELEVGEFDFVHTRIFLIHVPAREEVLRRLVAALRPGGILMVEEDDAYPVLGTATGDYRDGWDAFLAATSEAGVDPAWARVLPERLDQLALRDVDAAVDTQLFRGGSPTAEFWSLTWFQVRDRTDEDAIDRGRAALADTARWYHGPARHIVWGRR
jgi:SAM-dependent methyltransferase